MNDTLSLLLAASILAASGLGLYMYKSRDEDQKGGEEYNETNLFGLSDEEEEVKNDEDFYVPKQKLRSGKTKRNIKSGGTKRRY
jgi:hypothetical protein